jgi:hypothetical protein
VRLNSAQNRAQNRAEATLLLEEYFKHAQPSHMLYQAALKSRQVSRCDVT